MSSQFIYSFIDLFISITAYIMFGPFVWYPGPPPSGAFIRAMPVFRQPEHAKDVVRCCRNHTAEHSGKKKIYFSCFWGLAVVISEEFFSEYDAKAMQT